MDQKPNEELIQVTIGMRSLAKGQIKSWGNSLAVRIPTEVARQAHITEGSNVNFHISDDGNIVLRPAYPAADDQEGLRALFLSLRGASKPGVRAHEEQFVELLGDEIL